MNVLTNDEILDAIAEMLNDHCPSKQDLFAVVMVRDGREWFVRTNTKLEHLESFLAAAIKARDSTIGTPDYKESYSKPAVKH